MLKRSTIFFLILALPLLITAQTETPFTKGANLSGWFQASGSTTVNYTRYQREDFENIRSLGMDVVRLPINLHSMTLDKVDYVLDPMFLRFLDSAITWATDNELHLIIDNHTFDPAIDTDPSVADPLKKVWLQLATRYKDHGPNIYYEILNEPHGIGHSTWNTIQGEVIDVIRSVDDTHTIIVGGAEWNSYNSLDEIPEYEDDNLIYTYHFYDPFLFTHQGASWTDPSMVPLAGVPFPYNPATMPDVPSELVGTWVADNMTNDYPTEGTAEKVKELLDIAIDFSTNRNVPVYCGEFGVYNLNCDLDQRANWYDTVSSYLSAHNVAWTMWDYHGGFGLFLKDSYGDFNSDLDTALLRAMSLNVPPQEEYIKTPDTAGFIIYDDFLAHGIQEVSYLGADQLNFYCTDLPNNDEYCIKFRDPSQYAAIQLKFGRVKDLSYLLENDYALDFMFRGDSAGTSFDVRFVDSDLGEDDHPWRSRYTFTNSNLEFDNGWHHVHIPLSDFTEQGAWENAWYEPEGLFDWTEIDAINIVAEHGAFNGDEIWIDNLHITNMDTAMVYETGYTGYIDPLDVATRQDQRNISISRTPEGNLHIETDMPSELLICDVSGRVHLRKTLTKSEEISMNGLPKGIYFIRVDDKIMRWLKY